MVLEISVSTKNDKPMFSEIQTAVKHDFKISSGVCWCYFLI